MTFSFHILGLFIAYFIYSLYVTYSKIIKKELNFYRLLISNLGSQILFLLTFIILNKELSYSIIFVKLFLGSLVVCSSMLFCYTYSKTIYNKYIGHMVKYNEFVKYFSNSVLVIDFVIVLLLFISDIMIDDLFIYGVGVKYTFIICLLYIIVSIFTMTFNVRKFSLKNYVNLYACIFISLMVLVYQYFNSNLCILASGYTFCLLYLYINLESVDALKIKSLEVAVKSLEDANSSKTEFLEKLSREIRTPLNTIDGFSQVLLEEDNISNIKDDVKDIRTASNNLIDLVDGIMDISLIEAGKMSICNRNYDTLELFDSLNTIAKSLVGKKDVLFSISYADNIPKVLYGDDEKIKRILVNLINNSFKYTNKGYVKVNVSAVNSNDICRLIVEVIDTGCGIKKEDINNIFNQYEIVNNNNKSNGIGLSIVDNLINLMNGKLDVNSEEGKGSCFKITIDQKIIENEFINLTSKDSGNLDVFDCSNKRILIVDDNKLNLKVASKLLSIYNLDIVVASSGQEFLDVIDKDHQFDLILMDDMMPKMSGTETMEVFKKISRVNGFNIPVVVLTANAVSGVKNKYIDSGFDDYLAKPIDKYELNRVLKKFVKDGK